MYMYVCFGGRGTLAGEKGVVRVPIPTRGIHCGTLYMYVLCGLKRLTANAEVQAVPGRSQNPKKQWNLRGGR
jgi:hypothetical protein